MAPSVEDEAAAEERESRELWEAHFDARLSFLPHQDAVLTDLVDEVGIMWGARAHAVCVMTSMHMTRHRPLSDSLQSTKEQADFYKRLDPRVIERFLECEERTESTRLNLSCLGLQVRRAIRPPTGGASCRMDSRNRCPSYWSMHRWCPSSRPSSSGSRC